MFFAASKILVWFVYPLSLAVFLLLAAYAAHLRGKRRLHHALLLLAIGILYLCSIRPVADLLASPLESRHAAIDALAIKADVLVVLSGDLKSRISSRRDIEVEGNRVLKATRLFKQKVAPVIVMTGGSGNLFDQTFKEALLMKELAVELGVPAEKIIIEIESRNTRENALYTKPILEKLKAQRVVLVTSALHMPRSHALFQKMGVDAVPAPSDFYVVESRYTPLSFIPNVRSLSHSSAAIKEYVGIFVYHLRGWI